MPNSIMDLAFFFDFLGLFVHASGRHQIIGLTLKPGEEGII